jgi:hypothetical protein
LTSNLPVFFIRRLFNLSVLLIFAIVATFRTLTIEYRDSFHLVSKFVLSIRLKLSLLPFYIKNWEINAKTKSNLFSSYFIEFSYFSFFFSFLSNYFCCECYLIWIFEYLIWIHYLNSVFGIHSFSFFSNFIFFWFLNYQALYLYFKHSVFF